MKKSRHIGRSNAETDVLGLIKEGKNYTLNEAVGPVNMLWQEKGKVILDTR